MGAVRVLEPIASDSHVSSHAPTRQLTQNRRLRLLASTAAIATLLLLTEAAAPAPIESALATAPSPSPASPAAASPQQDAPLSVAPSSYRSKSVEAAERFVMMAHSGNSDGLIELMLHEVSRPGTGTAQYPHLPTDAGLWSDGVLDRARVDGFVGYMSTLQGSVEVSDCASVAAGSAATLVGCEYTATGGPLAPLSQEPETGRLYVVTIGAKVAGLIRIGETPTDLWDRFADWVARHHPDRSPNLVRSARSGWVLDPGYSRANALDQDRLAQEMAVALADGSAVTSPDLGSDPSATRSQGSPLDENNPR